MKRGVFLAGLLILLLFLTSCGPQEIYLCSDGMPAGNQQPEKKNIVFVCPDGTRTVDADVCKFTKLSSITQETAKVNALAYVQGYVVSNGWNPVLVNANLVDGDWIAQIIVSKLNQESYETSVRIDGSSGFANCEKNCHYIS